MNIRTVFLAAFCAAGLGGMASAQTLDLAVGGQHYQFEVDDNALTASLAAQLPQPLVFEDYGSTERIAYLKEKLDTSNGPSSYRPARGDLCYYAPWGNLCVFREPFRESRGLLPVGHLSEDAVRAIEQSGSDPVVFSVLTK